MGNHLYPPHPLHPADPAFPYRTAPAPDRPREANPLDTVPSLPPGVETARRPGRAPTTPRSLFLGRGGAGPTHLDATGEKRASSRRK